MCFLRIFGLFKKRYCSLFLKINALKLILKNRDTLFLTITLLCWVFCGTPVEFKEDQLKLLEIMTNFFFLNPEIPEMSLMLVYFSSCAAFEYEKLKIFWNFLLV